MDVPWCPVSGTSIGRAIIGPERDNSRTAVNGVIRKRCDGSFVSSLRMPPNFKEIILMSKLSALKLAAATLVAGAGLSLAPSANAGGYYYAPVSYYVAPPVLPQYGYYPVAQSLPIAVYRPVVVAPAPVVGYYSAVPAAPVRVYERSVVTPCRSRSRVDVIDPYGPDYHLRTRQHGGVVRYNERWTR